jgi:plastocyanin
MIWMNITGRVPIIAFFLVLAVIAITPAASAVSLHGGNLTCAFAEVHFRNGTVDPAYVHIYKNATVVWVNHGPEEHAISIGDDISPPLLAGESYTKNFHEFGEYEFYCRYHPAERGKVIVR